MPDTVQADLCTRPLSVPFMYGLADAALEVGTEAGKLSVQVREKEIREKAFKTHIYREKRGLGRRLKSR